MGEAFDLCVLFGSERACTSAWTTSQLDVEIATAIAADVREYKGLPIPQQLAVHSTVGQKRRSSGHCVRTRARTHTAKVVRDVSAADGHALALGCGSGTRRRDEGYKTFALCSHEPSRLLRIHDLRALMTVPDVASCPRLAPAPQRERLKAAPRPVSIEATGRLPSQTSAGSRRTHTPPFSSSSVPIVQVGFPRKAGAVDPERVLLVAGREKERSSSCTVVAGSYPS